MVKQLGFGLVILLPVLSGCGTTPNPAHIGQPAVTHGVNLGEHEILGRVLRAGPDSQYYAAVQDYLLLMDVVPTHLEMHPGQTMICRLDIINLSDSEAVHLIPEVSTAAEVAVLAPTSVTGLTRAEQSLLTAVELAGNGTRAIFPEVERLGPKDKCFYYFAVTANEPAGDSPARFLLHMMFRLDGDLVDPHSDLTGNTPAFEIMSSDGILVRDMSGSCI